MITNLRMEPRFEALVCTYRGSPGYVEGELYVARLGLFQLEVPVAVGGDVAGERHAQRQRTERRRVRGQRRRGHHRRGT